MLKLSTPMDLVLSYYVDVYVTKDDHEKNVLLLSFWIPGASLALISFYLYSIYMIIILLIIVYEKYLSNFLLLR